MKPTKTLFLIFIRRLTIIILGFLSTFFVTAFFGAIIPSNNIWEPPNDGIDIYVETNGVHVSIILPLHNDKGILRNKLQASHMRHPQYHSEYAMIGWGHKGVYLRAENWNDLTLSDASSAVFGTGNSLLHIYYLQKPKPSSYRKKIRISQVQYFHILNNIARYFQYNNNGKLNVYTGYSPNNIFYEANGRYSILNTCNVWAGRMLREAGIKIGYWTVFSQSIMYQF